MTPTRFQSRLQQGMSMVELMIAMTLGILIVLGVTTLFVQNKKSFNQGEMVARLQEDARFALNTIVDDLELVGFWADVHDSGNVDTHPDVVIGGTSCNGTTDWVTVAQFPVIAHDGQDGGASATFGCIAAADEQDDSDAIAINRVIGTPISQVDIDAGVASLAANTLYMRSNGVNGLLLDSTMDGSLIAGTINYWRYAPKLYYVRNYADNPGDGIPTLCVFELDTSGTPAMKESCIAQGVESLQIEYGIDTDTDGVANQYASSPSANLLQGRLVSVRVQLLMRSAEVDPAYTNTKTYAVGNLVDYKPADNYHRRVYTTTVLVRNTRNLRCLVTGCPK